MKLKIAFMAIALAVSMNVAIADDCNPEVKKPVATKTKDAPKKNTVKKVDTKPKADNSKNKDKPKDKPKPKPTTPKPKPKPICEPPKPPIVSVPVIPFPFPPAGDIVIVPMPIPLDPLPATEVPEPSTIAMFGLGLAGLLAIRRKK